MNRIEFQDLVALPNKRVVGDIEFIADSRKGLVKKLRSLVVEGTQDWTVKVDGWYNPLTDGLSFTFSCAQVGQKPICRVDVRGPAHDVGGRTHKHELRNLSCPRLNLPTRLERTDLESMTPQEVWEDLCHLANLQHQGQFHDPR